MSLSTVAVIISTLIGPVLAVQAQKWVERGRARAEDKERVFRVLMSTRAARLSDEHVKALNMIDIAFRAGQPTKRTKAESSVINRWSEFRGHLSVDQGAFTDIQKNSWGERANDYFLAMLEEMAKERGYDVDKHQLAVGGYQPMAYGYVQSQQEDARRLLLEVLRGDRAVCMAIKEVPDNTEMMDMLKSLSEDAKKS